MEELRKRMAADDLAAALGIDFTDFSNLYVELEDAGYTWDGTSWVPEDEQ